MTPEITGYRPDQAPPSAPKEKLVFTPEQYPHLEFDIRAVAEEQGRTLGADSPEVAEANEAVADAYAAVNAERDEAATRTLEHISTDAELGSSVGANAQTFAILRPMVEQHGFDFDSKSVAEQQGKWNLN